MAVPILFDDECFLDPNLVSTPMGERVPMSGTLEWANTSIRNPITGVYKTNVNRPDPTYTVTMQLQQAVRADVNYVLDTIRGGYGSGVGLRMRYIPDFTADHEVFGLGDGTTTNFNLYKTYTRRGVTARQDVRRIIKPVAVTLLTGGSASLYEADGVTTRVVPSADAISLGIPAFTIYKDNVATTAYTVNNKTGVVTFAVAPANGVVLSWSGEFDLPVAFVGNSFTQDFDVPSEIKGLMWREILGYELGIT